MFASRPSRANPILETSSSFHRLKPVCVQILGLASNTTFSQEHTQNLVFSLQRLKATLETAAREPLSPALIHYVFYPLAQLLRASPRGAAELPDRVRQLLFECLGILASKWWLTWTAEASKGKPATTDWSVWQQLVILGALAVGGNPGPKGAPAASTSTFSDETKLAAVTFLHDLVRPRYKEPKPTTPRKKEETWEWDGESDLPSLDELESEEKQTIETLGVKPSIRQTYPTLEHVDFAQGDVTAKGAVGHALTSCLELACSPDTMLELRETSLRVSHDLLRTWLAGAIDVSSPNDFRIPTFEFIAAASQDTDTIIAAEMAAKGVRPLLPGITSLLTRLISSRPKDASQLNGPKKATPGGLCALGLAMLRDLILLSLADATTKGMMAAHTTASDNAEGAADGSSTTQPKIVTLEDLVTKVQQQGDVFEGIKEESGSIEEVETDDTKTPAAQMEEDDKTEASTQPGTTDAKEGDMSTKWLLPTLARIQIALRSFTPLSMPSLASLPSAAYSHPLARRGLVNLAHALIVNDYKSLSWFTEQAGVEEGNNETAVEMLFAWIMDLAGESDIDSVVKDARTALNALVTSEELGLRRVVLSAFKTTTARALSELPKAIRGQDDERVVRLAIRLDTAASLASGRLVVPSDSTTKHIECVEASAILSERFGPSSGVERWGSALLECLRVTITPGGNMNSTSADSDVNWPTRPDLSGLEMGTKKVVLDMFRSFGRAAARTPGSGKTNLDSFHVILFFIKEGARYRSCHVETSESGRSASATLLASELLRGVAEELDDKRLAKLSGDQGKKLRKLAHKLGKEVFNLVMDMWDMDWEETIEQAPSSSALQRQTKPEDDTDSLAVREEDQDTLVEHVKGLSLESQEREERPERFGPALDLDFVNASKITTKTSASKPSSAASRVAAAETLLNRSNALLFSLLSSSAMLLGQSFSPLLLRGIYPLISGLASSDSGLRAAAEMAFRDIAHASAYASVQSCVLDHADYLLGSACQRLVSGLDEELRAQISQQTIETASASKELQLATVGTATIAPLVSAQKAPFVLVEMIRMLGSEVVPLVEDAVDEIMDALDRFHGYEDVCGGLLAVLNGILGVMAEEEHEIKREALPSEKKGPLEEFEAWYRARDEKLEPAFDTAVPEENSEPPEATRSQQVVTQMLEKAVPFMSHPSSHLRARVLILLRHGVEVLGSQKREPELLPVVNRAWPLIMARLGRSATSGGQNRPDRILDLDNHKHADLPLTETEPFVWIEAVRLVESLAAHVPQFVGKRIVQEAWPRFEALLRSLRSKFGPPEQKLLQAKDAQVSTGDTPLILSSATSVPAELTLSILRTMTQAVNITMSNDAAWEISTHPCILTSLDRRQPHPVRRAGKDLLVSLARRDWDAVWLALHASVLATEVEGMPAFLRQERLIIQKETVDEILDAGLP